MLVFMKATDACILVGKVEFILAHSQGIFCKSDVFDNFAQVTLAPQRVRGATHCTRMLLALSVIQPRHRHASYTGSESKIFSFFHSFSAAFLHIQNMVPTLVSYCYGN